MKRKSILIAMLILGAVCLGACGKKTSEAGSAGSGAATQDQGSQDQAGQDQGTQDQGTQDQGSQDQGSQDQGGAEVDPSATYDAQNQADDETFDENAVTDLGWGGTFNSASGESITITDNGDSVSFAFANAGISGSASVSGQQAVYEGEDSHQIIFSLSGDTVTVTVTSSQNPDGEESPMAGSYDRQ